MKEWRYIRFFLFSPLSHITLHSKRPSKWNVYIKNWIHCKYINSLKLTGKNFYWNEFSWTFAVWVLLPACLLLKQMLNKSFRWTWFKNGKLHRVLKLNFHVARILAFRWNIIKSRTLVSTCFESMFLRSVRVVLLLLETCIKSFLSQINWNLSTNGWCRSAFQRRKIVTSCQAKD